MASKLLRPEAYLLQANLTQRTIVARFDDRRWIQIALDDYSASPASVTRRIETVRHTVRAITILLLTDSAPEIVAQTAWAIVDEAPQLTNSDGGWSEFRPNTGESALYATLYVFHLSVLIGRYLDSGLRNAAYDALHEEISPAGRLRNPDAGISWDAPEYVLAIRTAFALARVSDRQDGASRLARLQDWIFSGATHEEPVRTCDVAFMAEMWLSRDTA